MLEHRRSGGHEEGGACVALLTSVTSVSFTAPSSTALIGVISCINKYLHLPRNDKSSECFHNTHDHNYYELITIREGNCTVRVHCLSFPTACHCVCALSGS